MAFALVGASLFDGAQIWEGRAVVIEGGLIRDVPDVAKLPDSIERHPVEGLLAPGFIDVQVNGGGGVLFNDMPSVEGLRRIAAAHRAYGTTGLLPTFITDRRERMAEAIEAVRQALREDVPGILGIHLEGPFINPERKGVHEPAFIRAIEEEDIALLTSLKEGHVVVTLAPERTGMDVIARLCAANVLVCAGHTAGDYATIMEACRHGLRGFTHLFNAMPPLVGRDPGPVGAALDSTGTWCGLIVDGYHVSDAALRIAVAAKGPEHMMLVTDAMSVTGTDLKGFDLHGRKIIRADGKLTTEDGTLAGSDLDMASAVRNAVQRLNLELTDALRMASLVPATFLRLDHELGRIAEGYRANLVLLDENMIARRTWIDGKMA